MKKYMAPVTEIIDMEASAMICASNGEREGDISKDDPTNPYQNPDWHYKDPIEDDDGELNSQSKGNDVIVDDDNW